ncbi:hypothetical protein HCA61_22910 [Rhodococcus sp. HNM0563]|uniref:hypothetical protein n=1 Tax=Rhodococcus sp. HNM0563 TaxID=2716339 RepID=UPI00146A0825|nr:hypothetical protein [Rhodococcus sp. HNM0563]NLU65089.1 hypothetical protein [Rhodococcus sp. HNM0563]
MSTPLKKVVDDQLEASGMAAERLDDADVQYVRAGVERVLSSLKARRAWENHLGPILTHRQMLDITEWSKQALSQAVHAHRVLRLRAEDGTVGYWSAGLTETVPHRPLPGLKEALTAWAGATVDPWTVASWFSTEQPELDDRTPRKALVEGDIDAVVILARQAAARLAA